MKSVDTKLLQQIINVTFLMKLEGNATNIHKTLEQVYGAMNGTQIFVLVKGFQEEEKIWPFENLKN